MKLNFNQIASLLEVMNQLQGEKVPFKLGLIIAKNTSLLKKEEEFYKKVTTPMIKKYLVSLQTRDVGGEIVSTGDDIQATRWSALNTFFVFLTNNNYIKEYFKQEE